MATEHIPRRICDRPSCGATVTDKGGRFALHEGEPLAIHPKRPEGEPDTPINSDEPSVHCCSVDLCRTCAASLQTWWTARARRGEGATVEG